MHCVYMEIMYGVVQMISAYVLLIHNLVNLLRSYKDIWIILIHWLLWVTKYGAEVKTNQQVYGMQRYLKYTVLKYLLFY